MVKVGKYTLGKQLGSGSFGVVKLAVDEDENAFAIKIISLKLIKEKKLAKQVKREIALMKLLKHKHIVQLIEVLKSETDLYLVLELVQKGELFDLIDVKKKLDEAEARLYFGQIIDAVSYCHSQNIAHRDIKAENVLLSDAGEVKIADFGLSNMWDGKEIFQTVCGTLGYASPQVLKGYGYDGAPADIWSCGILLYTMLVGYMPYEEASIAMLLRKINKGGYDVPDHLSKGAVDLIAHILVADPLKRYTVKDIVEHPWMKKEAVSAYDSASAVQLALPAILEEDELEEVEEVQESTPPGSSRALKVVQESMRLEFLETTVPPLLSFDRICAALERMGYKLKKSDKKGSYKVKAVKGEFAVSVMLCEGSTVHNIQMRPISMFSEYLSFVDAFKEEIKAILSH
jgi:5'-AMP-activated protein kinase, catalytic alpha subunit